MKISKKNLMAFVKNHAYGEEVLGKGTIRSQTINSVFVEFMFGERVSYNEVWYNNRSFHIV
jgi:hypothetical protein